MDIHVDAQAVITAAAFIAAFTAILVFIKKGFAFFSKPDELDKEIKALREKHDADMEESNEERQLVFYALFGCLDGLEQLGCNHSVPETKKKLEKHLNEKAHNYKRGNSNDEN